MTPDWAPDQHVPPKKLAAYVDKHLSESQTADVEKHLVECANCRSAVLSAARYHQIRRRRWWLFGAGPIAAAAALATVVIVGGRDQTTPTTVLRSDTPEGVASLTPIHPAPEAVLADDRTFRWNALGAGVPYRITVTDAVGRELWTDDTGDTTIVLPDRVELPRDGVYFWRVGALLSDGRPATMRYQEFRAAR